FFGAQFELEGRRPALQSRTSLRRTSICADHSISQDPDAVDVEFDCVAAFKKATDLQTAAVADGAGPEELACANRLILRRISQDFFERKQHVARIALRARLAEIG